MTERLAETGAEFARQLEDLGELIDADVSKVLRYSVLKIFQGIVMGSPVLTGSYRASHDIANGDDPAATDALQFLEQPRPLVDDMGTEWTWKIGDGNITIYNNMPYATELERGSSNQAPAGVYTVALHDFTRALAEMVRESKVLS